MKAGARPFGRCYVCRREVFGFVVRPARPYATSSHTRLAWEDSKGIRHSTCEPAVDATTIEWRPEATPRKISKSPTTRSEHSSSRKSLRYTAIPAPKAASTKSKPAPGPWCGQCHEPIEETLLAKVRTGERYIHECGRVLVRGCPSVEELVAEASHHGCDVTRLLDGDPVWEPPPRVAESVIELLRRLAVLQGVYLLPSAVDSGFGWPDHTQEMVRRAS
jgi:hypothetical protein